MSLFKSGKKGKDRGREPEWPAVNLASELETIRTKEDAEDTGLGRRIHGFAFHEYELCLDRDVTGQYRIVAFQGKEKKYSFSVRSGHKDYDSLKQAFETVTQYLSGDRRIADLPKGENLKGFYFG